MDELQFDQYSTEQKQQYWTQETVLKKIKDIFPQEELNVVAEALCAGDLKPPRVQLAILRICNGSLDEVRRLVEVADGDVRDVLMVEYLNQLSFDIDNPDVSSEANIEVQRKDLEEYRAWIRAGG